MAEGPLWGQKLKSSMRVYVFRCSPNIGHRQDTSACPFRAKSRPSETLRSLESRDRPVGNRPPSQNPAGDRIDVNLPGPFGALNQNLPDHATAHLF